MKWKMMKVTQTLLIIGILFGGMLKARERTITVTSSLSSRNETVRVSEKVGNSPILNIYQQVALSVTQTIVLQVTREDRRIYMNHPYCDIAVRGARVLFQYRRDEKGETLYLAAGTRIRWKVVNGQWVGGNVTPHMIASVLDILESNGFSLNRFSVITNRLQQHREVEELCHYLGINSLAVLAYDPQDVPRIVVTFSEQVNP